MSELMNTVALRFSNNFAPNNGTIVAHEEVIDQNGYVWYGKLGNRISTKVAKMILNNTEPAILLIHSGAADRYWAYIDRIQFEVPPIEEIPEYYRDKADKFKTWFRVIRFESAPQNVMARCTVKSSGAILSMASRHSMSPYFIIEYAELKG